MGQPEAVIDTLMPKGVEHLLNVLVELLLMLVIDTLMPKGVEHLSAGTNR